MDKKALDGLALLHDLVPFLPMDRLHAILNDEALPDEAHGAALFADISGFTALAERLARELGPERGAEELNTQINTIFVGLIDAVDRFHGSVIRFSGDGITAWFAGEDSATRAATASLAMQAVSRTLQPALPNLQIKIGIGSGQTRRFRPGDPALGVYDVLTGPAVEQMSQAEGLARPGQIVLSPAASAELGRRFEQQPLRDGFSLLSTRTLADLLSEARRWPSIRWLDHVERAWELVEACRPYLPAPIYERLAGGRGTYMADLRTVTPLFIRFTGIDYTAPQAAQQLDELVRAAQSIVALHGGYLSEVGVGDKGNVLVALFGAPVALENPAGQAGHAALALREELPHVEGLYFGFTCGQLFTGTAGSPMRRAYAAIGGEVNLAARLMSHARRHEILADYQAYHLSQDFAWEALPPLRVKGRGAPVRVYRLLGLAEITRPLWPAGRFVARVTELQALHWLLETAQGGQARILVMKGEPGLGKSHLLREFKALLGEHGITGLFGAGRSVEQQTPYRAWREIFAAYFDLGSPNKKADSAAHRAQVLAHMEALSPELAAQAPLLNDVLQLGIPEGAHTAALEPAQRHVALVNLLVALLERWLAEDTLALAIDNAQWLDTLSWDLVCNVGQRLAGRPLAILLAMRPPDGTIPPALRQLEALPNSRELVLRPLRAEDVESLAALQLGVGELPGALTQLIMQKTGGNPLFINEVVSVLRESGIIDVGEGRVVLKGDPATLQVPDTVQGVVRSRIDRLPPDRQVLLKVAAVIGPQFYYRTLRDVQPLRLSEEALLHNLEALRDMDLHRVKGTDDDPIYAFRYAITREVAYHALSFSQRRQLHSAIARWYEHEYVDDLAPYYTLLAHHWHEAEEPERERHYSYLAGLQAMAHYANDDAIAYLERALELTPADDPAGIHDTLVKLEDVYHLRGKRKEQQHILSALLDMAQETGNDRWRAQAETLWARYHDSMAGYTASLEAARRGFAAAQRASDRRMMGLSSVYWGLALAKLGHYQEASERLSYAFMPDANDLEAWRLDILGTTLIKMGRHSAARQALEEALGRAEAINEQAAMGRILDHLGLAHTRLGNYEQALRYYERALSMRATIGDRQGEAATLLGLGSLALGIGDYQAARRHLEEGLLVFRDIGDRGGEAEALNRLGCLAYTRGQHQQARDMLGEALAIQRAIGDRHGSQSSLSGLALVEIALGNHVQAESYLGEALSIGQDLAMSAQAAHHYANWALIALRLGNQHNALEHVQAAQEVIGAHGLAALPAPLETCLTCYQVLEGLGQQEAAREFLKQAYDLLIARADRIVDLERRARYLLTVPTHRQIMLLYDPET